MTEIEAKIDRLKWIKNRLIKNREVLSEFVNQGAESSKDLLNRIEYELRVNEYRLNAYDEMDTLQKMDELRKEKA